MEKKPNKNYPIQVWVTTLFVSPILGICLGALFTFEFDWELLLAPFLSLILGAFISLPAFLLFWWLFGLLSKTIQSENHLKALLSLIVAIFIFLTLLVILDTPLRNRFSIIMITSFVTIGIVACCTFRPFISEYKNVKFSFEEDATASDNK